MLQGTCTFPGIESIVEATISFVHGISASVATLTIKPQLNFIGEGGTLTFLFGDEKVDFPDCKIDYSSLQRNNQGEVWRLSIFDRRWKWKWGKISGFYNTREDDGSLKVGFEKTPHQLAELCFAAIGETGFSLAEMPNDAEPEIEWEYDSPMEALAQICDDLGCRIVLGLDNRVKIWKTGQGSALPLDGVLENSLTIDPPERPDSIAIICGRTRFQVDFPMLAVGKDLDGTIKPIASLSYIPVGGWGTADLLSFENVHIQFGWAAQVLALETVFRWYQVNVRAGLKVPGFDDKIFHLDRLDIEEQQVLTKVEDGVLRNRPALVYGIWEPGYGPPYTNVASVLTPHSTDTEEVGAYRREHQFDAETNVVKFSERVYRNTTTGKITAGDAQLRLRAACNVRADDTWAWIHFVRTENLGGNFGTKTRYVSHDELVHNLVPKYGPNYQVEGFLVDNLQEIASEADHYLDGLKREYEQTLPQSIVYMGLRPIELDGAIQQIIFTVGKQFATTMVTRNMEVLHRTLSYRERRRVEKQVAANKLQRKVKKQLRRPKFRRW
ncbi:hypothetical protein LCGC14_0326480 [marine sediment metagenome]|uniref:Uncharacterized protein n=1 Tax=marine sediment metagenome TaxID=412755 RepID=A0A0F9W5B0_9ZZZZ